MISTTRYKWLLWLVLFLFAMNAATIASLVFHTRKTEKDTELSRTTSQDVAQTERGARFFRERLRLSPEQTLRFREINRNYNRATHRIAADLEHLRIEMVTQMGRTNPDTVRLNAICRQIGIHHENLKKQTVAYYFEMKETCSEDQQELLNGIFRNMVERGDSLATNPGRGRGYRWRGPR